jgi:hypothetical protein
MTWLCVGWGVCAFIAAALAPKNSAGTGLLLGLLFGPLGVLGALLLPKPRAVESETEMRARIEQEERVRAEVRAKLGEPR